MINLGIYGWVFLLFYAFFAVLCFVVAIKRYIDYRKLQDKKNRLKIIEGGKK